ncbi:MAG: hypothetical protein L7U72_08245 [Rubripirellula sp.]|nr:hypothetical protein [Rubripirellula sp.]
MQEDLLGYLLGALDDAEMRRISERLQEDSSLVAELERLKRITDTLENAYVPVEAPCPDLLQKTLDLIAKEDPSFLKEVPENAIIDRAFEGKTDLLSADAGSDAGRLDGASQSVRLTDASTVNSYDGSSGYRWWDWIGATVAAAVVLCIILPALANGRFEARKIACQDQLRRFGVALTEFVSRSPEQRLPAVAESGPEAFAGVYALRLNEAGLLPEGEIRWCPSMATPESDSPELINLGEIKSLDRLHDATIDELRAIQQYSGGHYAYNLGVLDEHRFTSPRFEARASFAVMADAPLLGNLGSGNLGSSEKLTDWIGHGGRGINVLFEDGRVRFISVDSLQAMPDHPLLNHEGNVEAGVNIDDATLGPSWRPPFLDVSQR